MADRDAPVLTPEAMISDVRMQARYVRNKTPLPERIAELLDEVADEITRWKVASDREKING